MLSVCGRVTGRGPAGVWVKFEGAEEGCRRCAGACRAKGPVHLPLKSPVDEIVVSVDVLLLLAHSFGLPLAGFVLGALAAEAANFTEAVTILGALLGMGAGIVLCKTQSFDRIHISNTRISHNRG